MRIIVQKISFATNFRSFSRSQLNAVSVGNLHSNTTLTKSTGWDFYPASNVEPRLLLSRFPLSCLLFSGSSGLTMPHSFSESDHATAPFSSVSSLPCRTWQGRGFSRQRSRRVVTELPWFEIKGGLFQEGQICKPRSRYSRGTPLCRH
jgi:hypothetical protein